MTSDEGLLTFGTTFQISGVDGASIDSLGMVLILDPGRQTLTLHSGNVKVSRVYFHPSPNIQVSSNKNTILQYCKYCNSREKSTVFYLMPFFRFQMANIAHEIAGLRLDASSQNTPWSSKIGRQLGNLIY
jgi:hypothetical protein